MDSGFSKDDRSFSRCYRVEQDDEFEGCFQSCKQQDGSGKYSFEELLDRACSELQKKSAFFHLEKIDKLTEKIKNIEDALDQQSDAAYPL